MKFPMPPPVKEKPLAPCVSCQVYPKRPGIVWFIIGVSVLFWLTIAWALSALLVWMFGSWIAMLPYPRMMRRMVFVVASWYAIAIGWHVGSAIILTALRRKD